MGSHHQGAPKEVKVLDAFIKLRRASESISARLSQDFLNWEITESQFGILEALLHLGPLCQKELGNKILKSTGNITLVIDNLEKRGFVFRVRETDDRRFIKVHLTDLGKSFIEKIFPFHVQRIKEEFAVLDDSELYELGQICKKLGKQPVVIPRDPKPV